MMRKQFRMNKSPALHLHRVGYAAKSIDLMAVTYVNHYKCVLATPVTHDPLQIAFVQFLKLAGDWTYPEFLAPDGSEGKPLTHPSAAVSIIFAIWPGRSRKRLRNLKRPEHG